MRKRLLLPLALLSAPLHAADLQPPLHLKHEPRRVVLGAPLAADLAQLLKGDRVRGAVPCTGVSQQGTA